MNKILFFYLVLIFYPLLLQAQPVICNGELGIPILNFDFGQGNSSQNWFSPLSVYAPGLSTSTSLQTGGSLPAANTSGLVKNTGTFGPAPNWLNTNDHTGNPNGLLFGINMPANVGTTVVEYEMNGLCPNTTLEFSIWLVNLMSPNHPMVVSNNPNIEYPNLIMRIVDASNNLIAEHITGNVPTDGIWHQYSFLFSNGNNTNLKLQLINNTLGSGSGNDVGLDDISLRPCVPSAQISPKLDTTFCQSTTVDFHANITPGIYSAPVFQWQYSTDNGATWVNSGAASGNPNFTFTFSTQNARSQYLIRYLTSPNSMGISSNCQAVSDSSVIRIDTIDHDFIHPKDTLFCNGVSFNLNLNTNYANSYLWSTGATTPYLIIDSSGSYWAKITSLFGCTATDTINVILKQIDQPNLGNDTAFCEGQSYNLSVAGLNVDNFIWSTGETTPIIQVNESGKYWVQIFKDGCSSSDTIQVDFNPFPIVDLGEDIVLCEGGQVYLSSKKLNLGASYLWSTGDNSEGITVRTGGRYWLQITNFPDCINSDTINLEVQNCDCEFFVPNAFSPNNDGKNDLFIPKMIPETCPISQYSFFVFNRWGQLIFKTNQENKGWNGYHNNQLADGGVYFWYIEWKDKLGISKRKKGDLTLIK